MQGGKKDDVSPLLGNGCLIDDAKNTKKLQQKRIFSPYYVNIYHTSSFFGISRKIIHLQPNCKQIFVILHSKDWNTHRLQPTFVIFRVRGAKHVVTRKNQELGVGGQSIYNKRRAAKPQRKRPLCLGVLAFRIQATLSKQNVKRCTRNRFITPKGEKDERPWKKWWKWENFYCWRLYV